MKHKITEYPAYSSKGLVEAPLTAVTALGLCRYSRSVSSVYIWNVLFFPTSIICVKLLKLYQLQAIFTTQMSCEHFQQ